MTMPQSYTIIDFQGGNPLRCSMRRIGAVGLLAVTLAAEKTQDVPVKLSFK